jgi:hypothetical protein
VAIKRGLGPSIQAILDRGKAAGLVRPDVVAGDVPLLLAGLPESEAAAPIRQRYLAIILNGLRADEAQNQERERDS